MLRLALSLALVFPLVLGPSASAQEQIPPKETDTPQEQTNPYRHVLAELAKVHGESGLRNATLGFALIPLDAQGPEALTGYHENLALLPASTLKVVTTATAVDLLGTGFRFKTVLQYSGKIGEDGTLQGDVFIKGGGDPTLGASPISRTLALWQTTLEEAGIKKIEGRIVGDASLFGTQLRPDSWQWNDLGNYYAAGASGLNFHQNQFYCRFATGKVGSRARFLRTDPRLHQVTFINEMQVGAAGSGDRGYVYGAPYGTLLYLRGTLPTGHESFTIRGALPDPASFCARALSLHLEKNKIAITGEPTTVRRLSLTRKPVGKRTDLLTQTSDSLPALIATTNLRSDNLYAECLHRILGARLGRGGTTAASSRVVSGHWKAKGIDLTGFHMADGCGLSRANTITARQLTLILYHAAKSENFPTFYKSLPVAGRSGTLRNIGRGARCEGRVHAKSGSIERVKTYCGYLDAGSGKQYAFTILINNFNGSVTPIKAKIVRLWNKMVAL